MSDAFDERKTGSAGLCRLYLNVNAQVLRTMAMWTVLADLLSSKAEATGRAEILFQQDSEGARCWVITRSHLLGHHR